MTGSRLTPEVADWLEYFEDLGFDELYLAEPPAPADQKPQSRATAEPRLTSRAASQAGSTRTSSGRAAHAESELIDLTPVDDGTAAERAAELANLAETAQTCQRCRLCQGRNRVVFGAGHPNADLLLIGEGPGANEDREGLPFVGAAGQLLSKILKAIKLDRDQVYITNVVKCRPPNNRNPQPDEAAACRRFLDRQIELIRPRVILALGKVAAQTLLGNDLPLGRMRGEWYQVADVPTRVTYHPAALLRNERLKRPTWEDVQEVRDRLISMRE